MKYREPDESSPCTHARIQTNTPHHTIFFDVLLTVHLSIFISVFNQHDAQNLFHNKFYFMPLHFSSTCAHHQEVKIALHSLWYHHTETSEWSKITKIQFYKYEQIVAKSHPKNSHINFTTICSYL